MKDLRIKFIKSTKSEQNSKRADWKQEVIRFKVIEQPQNLTSEILTFIKEFTECAFVEKQLQLIKTAYKPELNDNTKKSFLEVFCKIYFLTPWKHPVKNCLQKIIDNENSFVDDIKKFIQSEILYAIKPCQYVISISNSELREIIGNVGALLENFKSGIMAFQESLEPILQAFAYTLRWYLRELRQNNVSPATKNELCSSVHNLIKIVIHAVTLFGKTMNYDGFIQEVMSNLKYVLNPFPEVEIPIDTKANAGILAAHFYRGIKEDPFREKIKGNVTIPNLCIVFGVITQLSEEYLTDYPHALEKILEFLHPAMISSTHDSSMALFIARAVSQLSKRLEMLQKTEQTEKMANICLDYAILSLDHDLDAVKNTAKEVIQSLVSIGLKTLPTILTTIFTIIKADSTDKRHKSVIISCVCEIAGAKFVSKEIPDVQKFLLEALEDAKSFNTNSETVLCYEKLMTSRLNNGVDTKIFFQEFIRIILDKIAGTKPDAVELRKSLLKLLHRSIKKCPGILELLLAEKLPIDISLSCLGAAKKSGVLNEKISTQTDWKSIIPFKVIKEAMVVNDEQVRMAALELIVEVHRLTEIFSQEEFECILYFLKHNINTEIPAIRSQIIGHMRNCLFRIENGLNFFNRNPEDVRGKLYKDFINNLATFCFSNFFVGANFGRRTVSLKILLQMNENLKSFPSLVHEMWSIERFDVILSLCNDTYESNKSDAVSLLKSCPKEFMHNRDVNVETVQQMIQSCKPMTSLTGAYYLEFLVFVHIDDENRKKINFVDKNESYSVLSAVLWLEKLLIKSFDVATKSLINAASQCPMYGELFAIRHLLSRIELTRGDPSNEEWKLFLTRFIPFCNKLTEVAAPIVNNSSPEGHLPNDFSSMKAYANPNDEQMLDKVTPQMVLLCAWRTVKEVSLLLGDLSFKAPLSVEKDDTGYITVEQILAIGTHFTTLLSETKHRGAFEQAYVGFTRLSLRLWSCNALELHSLPMRWLQSLIKIIAGEAISTNGLDMSVEKLCATRRSAGVPFLMQALVTAELQVGKSSALKFCMENLLFIAKQGNVPESRTHALNILRALYRCSELAQAVGQYVSEGFVVAIQGYDADSWAERNSATLLFSALMLRVFGVQRHKDSDVINIRNKMTGRTFFQRYPELYDFFYEILIESRKISQAGKRCRKLHSLLLLMGRLYPSSWEEIDSNLSLTAFIPLISGCTANAELKTRQLAAKIIPIIIPPNQVLTRISELVAVVCSENDSKTSVNSYHGVLLQIFYLVRSLSQKSSKDEEILTKIWMKIHNYLPQNSYRHIPLIVGTFIDILLEIYLINPHLTLNREDLKSVIEAIVKTKDTQPSLGFDIMMRKYGIYHFLSSIDVDAEKMENFFSNLLNLNFGYDFQESILNLLLLITNNVDQQDLEIPDLEVAISSKLIEKWNNKTKAFLSAIQVSNAFGDYLIDVINQNFYHQCTFKAYLLIGQSEKYLQKFMTNKKLSDYKSLIKLADEHCGNSREALFACIEKWLCNSLPESVDLEFLTEIVTPDNSDNMKMIGIRILRECFVKTKLCEKKNDTAFISYFFWSLFVLLRDDEADIRYETASLAMDISNAVTGEQDNQNVIASIAMEKLFYVLNFLLETNFDKQEKIRVYEEILRLDKLYLEVDNETNAVIDDANRCFDKNETNLFGENKFVQDECHRWLSLL
ncbi:tRNA (32-2'-O)-methyltransferase regulator THADA [Culicoides brevitarsis]|uniref:tRNA (32-2'-O)-methyltransferase regulator THADA n=1 Tax=Culicoides brevitarsis TaxID=469753 RepID=UPI00307BB2F7